MITVTEQAAAKIRDLLAEQEDAELCLRLSVDKGGCEGYSYGMTLDRDPVEDDQVVEAHGGSVGAQSRPGQTEIWFTLPL